VKNFFLLLIILPLYGCNSGSSNSELGSLFGSISPSVTLVPKIAPSGVEVEGGGVVTQQLFIDYPSLGLSQSTDTLATIHNPEPATMLLIGSGVIAMGYYKNWKSKTL
jgi:hypothetical protein